MPWTERSLMEDRLCFIAAYLREAEPPRGFQNRALSTAPIPAIGLHTRTIRGHRAVGLAGP